MTFDAVKHLRIIKFNPTTDPITLSGREADLEFNFISPKILFRGEVIPLSAKMSDIWPRISTIVDFPDRCTYGLGQKAKWVSDRTCLEAKLRQEKAQEQEKRDKLEEEEEELVEEEMLEEEKIEEIEKEIVRIKIEGKGEVEEKVELLRERKKVEEKKVEFLRGEIAIVTKEVIKTTERAEEVKREEIHFKKVRVKQATVFETGNTIHNQVRIKTRRELLAERKIFLLEDLTDWFKINDMLSKGFTIVGQEFPLYLLIKGLIVTGHPDNFVLTPEGILDIEEWKSSKTGGDNPSYRKQVTLYALGLKTIFNPAKINCTVKVWDKSRFPLMGENLLTRLKTGEVEVPPEANLSYSFSPNGQPLEIEETLDFTYKLYTAQIPCSEVSSGLCKDWCPIRYQCPSYRDIRNFVKNFKMEG